MKCFLPFFLIISVLLFSGCATDNGGDSLNLKGKKVIFVVAPSDFRDEELFHPKEVLEANGASTAIASLSKGALQGVMGGTAQATLSLNDVKAENFDAIVFVGGSGAQVYFNNSKAMALAREFLSAGKITSAICIAPSILANAGLLKGKKATCFSSEAANLKAKGATYTGKAVEVDGLLVTADGPSSAKAFGNEIAKLLSKS